ncbi:MAG: lytic transglycosylase domain-containing protein [Deltaproteobacteria bacterium]|nr:lytic transglycosylase domain-containing protein [Deltaproteobacteria bacterium]
MPKAFIILGVFFILMGAESSFADIYRYKDKNGKWHFTNIRSDVRYNLYIKEAQENPDAFIKKYDDIIKNAAQKFGLEPSLVKAVIKAESGFDHRAVSKKGAQGLMQLMPGTADEMAVDDPYNPEQNIFGGSRYLGKLMERYDNKIDHALAAYNAGPEKVDQYKGVPPYKETRTFIERVTKYYEEFKSGKK